MNSTSGLKNFDSNKRNEENDLDFIRKSKTNYNKSNLILKRIIKGYEKGESNDIKKIGIFGESDDNVITSNCKENF